MPILFPYPILIQLPQAFLDHTFKLHGLPASIVSDRDLVSLAISGKSYSGYKANLNVSSSHHPQSDDQTKVVNRCIEDYLRCMVGDKPKHWVKWLPLAKWWYNTT